MWAKHQWSTNSNLYRCCFFKQKAKRFKLSRLRYRIYVVDRPLSSQSVGCFHIQTSRLMSNFGRVSVTTKLGQTSLIVTDFQSEQLDYDRDGDRTRELKHRSTLTIPLRHRSLKRLHIIKLRDLLMATFFYLQFLFVLGFKKCDLIYD